MSRTHCSTAPFAAIALLVGLIAVQPIATPLAAQSADAAIDHAVNAWSTVKTVRASFEQTLSNALTGTSVQSTGEFLQQRPDKLSIVFTGGSGDRVIDDGRWLWIYLPSSVPGQVIREAQSSGAAAAPIDLSAQFLATPHDRFQITLVGTSTVNGMSATELSLVPKRADAAPFTHANVWITSSDGFIRQFQTEEASGVTRRVRLTSLIVNGAVSPSVFTFTPPRGVKIITH